MNFAEVVGIEEVSGPDDLLDASRADLSLPAEGGSLEDEEW